MRTMRLTRYRRTPRSKAHTSTKASQQATSKRPQEFNPHLGDNVLPATLSKGLWSRAPSGVGGSTLRLVLTLTTTTTYPTTIAPAIGPPGTVIVVCTSSLNCKSMNYCKTGKVPAPSVSGLTRRNYHFASTCSAASIYAPSHCTLFAKRCP